ncbi:hypothetical protein BU26DRAFT_501744 [Trematosphaeria pertusa]|uniref:Uncharacterized protein n=1 Tax=Trematosphaeria pertusa TaxID=390896 RepID=A0A6A6ITU0_9PLEO|nr:uncharacterized protein BU26DRAFT_501744 [Trematosphaeria pertusa]KAF2253588.1 hypothetical protein BU26DRAFT_501744 [Trematosphaeria pertusa]
MTMALAMAAYPAKSSAAISRRRLIAWPAIPPPSAPQARVNGALARVADLIGGLHMPSVGRHVASLLTRTGTLAVACCSPTRGTAKIPRALLLRRALNMCNERCAGEERMQYCFRLSAREMLSKGRS